MFKPVTYQKLKAMMTPVKRRTEVPIPASDAAGTTI